MEQSALSVFGQKAEVSDLAGRVKRFMAGTQNLTDTEALAVAQIALAHDLDPFNGEVWGIKGKDRDGQPGEWYGVMVGIKGLRKCAYREAQKEKSFYYTSFKCLANGIGENKSGYPAPEKYPKATVIVMQCYLRDDFSFKAWMNNWLAMKAAQATPEELEALGKPPVWIGTGVAYSSEFSKLEINARAKKRAEADAIKQRYPVEFRGAMVYGQTPEGVNDDDVIEGTSKDVPQGQLPTTPATENIVDQDLPRPWTPEQVVDQLTSAATVYMNNHKAMASDAQRRLTVMLMEKALANPNLEKQDREALEKERRMVTTFACGYASTKDMPGVTIQAILWWLHPDKDPSGNYLVPAYVTKEVRDILALVNKKNGQLEMPLV